MLAADNQSVRSSVDTNLDGQVSLDEVLRIVQFYNGGGYHCAEDSTEDGYEPGPDPDGKAIDTDCVTHDSDYNPADGLFNLSELLRVIQLFASDGYARCEGGEDGFCI